VLIILEPIFRERIYLWRNEHKFSFVAFTRSEYRVLQCILHDSLLHAICYYNQFHIPLSWSCAPSPFNWKRILWNAGNVNVELGFNLCLELYIECSNWRNRIYNDGRIHSYIWRTKCYKQKRITNMSPREYGSYNIKNKAQNK
jgi:hypothetical protein